VAFNFQSIDEQVLATIRVLDVSWEDGDNVGVQLYASKLFFAQNDDERLGAIIICRVLCEPEWIEIFKEHDMKHKSQLSYTDFQSILGELRFSKHSNILKDKPV
jgi:hypothetical protein